MQHDFLNNLAARAVCSLEYFRWFLHNIWAIMAKIELPKKILSMVIFWIKVRRSYRDLSSQADPGPREKIELEVISVVLMTEMSAFKKLVSLNPSKAHGSDEIPGWLLKENADLLTIPICDIINCSYQEGRLPSAWKEANVIPVPKQRPIKDVNITIEFMFAGINMFWARLRLILARAARRGLKWVWEGPKTYLCPRT